MPTADHGGAPLNNIAGPNEIVAKIGEFVASQLLQDAGVEIGPDTAMIENGLLTSLQAVELAMFLEEAFGIEIDPDDVTEQTFYSLKTIAELVLRKVSTSHEHARVHS